MKRIFVCAATLCVVCSAAQAARIGEDIILPNLTVTYEAEEYEDSVRTALYLVTPYTLTSVTSVLYTLPENHREWHSAFLISGIKNEYGRVEKYEAVSEMHTGTLSFKKEYGTFSSPYSTNQAYAYMTLEPATLLSGRFYYSEEVFEDELWRVEFSAQVEISGVFVNPSHGEFFVIPEPISGYVCTVALLGRRRKRMPRKK